MTASAAEKKYSKKPDRKKTCKKSILILDRNFRVRYITRQEATAEAKAEVLGRQWLQSAQWQYPANGKPRAGRAGSR